MKRMLHVIEMTEMKERIHELANRIDQARVEIRQMEDELARLQEAHQSTCIHKQFYAERDDDCHNCGWYFTCTECGYCTKRKPINSITIYQ